MKHKIAFIFAIIIGLLTVAGPLIGSWRIQGFAGVYKIVSDDEAYYLGRIKEAREGNCRAVSPYIAEYKLAPPITPWLAECFLGSLARVLGVSVAHFALALDFVLPALAAFLFYMVAWRITDSRDAGLIAMIVVQGGIFFEIMNRPISPQFNLVVLLGFMVALLWWHRTRSWLSVSAGAIVLAALIYTYFYYWSFAVMWCGLLALYFLWKKSWRTAAQLGVIIGGGLLLGGFYFLDLWRAIHLPVYIETLLRWGAIQTRAPGSWTILFVATGALLLLGLVTRFKKTDNGNAVLLVSALFAIIIASNQQIITNQNVLFASHYKMVGVYMAALAVALAATRAGIFTSRRSHKVFFVCACVVSLFFIQSTLAKQWTRDATTANAQRYAPLFTWLNEHTPRDVTIYTNDALSDLVPIYTHNTVVHGFLAGMSPLPTQELQQRFFVAHYGDAITDEFIRANQYWLLGGVCLVRPLTADCINPAFLRNQVQSALYTVRARRLRDWLQQYNVRFIVVDRMTDAPWKLELVASFPKLYAQNGVEVYGW